MTLMSFDVIEDGGSARLVLRGELDTASVGEANAALSDLLGGAFERVTVDLSELDFMDSTGIKFLIDGREAARRHEVEMALAYGGDPVERILTVSGVTALFERDEG